MKFIDCNDLLGIPFDEETNNCYDILREVHRRARIVIPVTNISVCACKEISNKEIERQIDAFWTPIDTPVVPCGVLIRSIDPRFANHVAAYIGLGYIVHVTMDRAVVIDRMSMYESKIIRYYKYVGSNCSN